MIFFFIFFTKLKTFIEFIWKEKNDFPFHLVKVNRFFELRKNVRHENKIKMNWIISFVFTLYMNSFELYKTDFLATRRVYSMANGPWMIKHQNLLNLYMKPLLIEHRTCTTATFTVYLCVRIDLAQNNISVCVQLNTCRLNHIHSQHSFIYFWSMHRIQRSSVFVSPQSIFFFLFSFFHFFSSVVSVYM